MGDFLLLDKCNTICYNVIMKKDIRNKVRDLNKDNLSEFVIIRVSVAEKIELRKKAQDSKNLSKYIRHVLGLDKND